MTSRGYVLMTGGGVVRYETYRAWKRTYSDAEALLDYVFERWRSDPYFYNHSSAPELTNMFGLVWRNV